MRRNPMALYIMFSCSMVLIALTSVSVKSQTPSFEGTYKLDAKASDNVNKAIEGAVKHLWSIPKRIASSNLRKINVRYEQISISYIEEEVSIKTDQRQPLRTPINGTPVDWTREDEEKIKVSTVMESGKMKRTFTAEAGQRINTYIISADGKTLTMDVSVTGKHLPQPLTYKLVYQRSS
jgi:hypothetical protein